MSGAKRMLRPTHKVVPQPQEDVLRDQAIVDAQSVATRIENRVGNHQDSPKKDDSK